MRERGREGERGRGEGVEWMSVRVCVRGGRLRGCVRRWVLEGGDVRVCVREYVCQKGCGRLQTEVIRL